MTAAEFRRAVEAELAQLRRAHVITAVDVESDMLVGVSLAMDGRPYEFTLHVTNNVHRVFAFEQVLDALRAFVRRTMGVTTPAPVVRPRVRVALERHVGEPTWPALLLLAALIALGAAVYGCVGFLARESSGPQRMARVGARTTAGNLTAKCGGPVSDDPAECVDRGGSRALSTRTCAAGRSRAL